MMMIKALAKTLLLLSAVLLFEGCGYVSVLDMKLPELLFQEGKCSGIEDEYRYGVCAAEQIEALKSDRKILLNIVQGCIK